MSRSTVRPRTHRYRRSSWVWLSSVLLSVLAGLPAHAASARMPAQLRAWTTIHVTSSAIATVNLASPATIKFDSSGVASPQVRLSGTGRFSGLVLTRVQPDINGVDALLVASYAACGSAGCSPGPPFTARSDVLVSFGVFPDKTGQLTLPAGTYRLRLFADGGPVTISLHLLGLSGTSHLALAPAAAPAIVEPAPAPQSNPLTYGAGATHALGDLGLMLYMQSYVSSPHAIHFAGACYYHNAQPPGGIPLLGCPEADAAGPLIEIGSVVLKDTGMDLGWALEQNGPGQWYQGYFRDGAQGPGPATLNLLWLPL